METPQRPAITQGVCALVLAAGNFVAICSRTAPAAAARTRPRRPRSTALRGQARFKTSIQDPTRARAAVRGGRAARRTGYARCAGRRFASRPPPRDRPRRSIAAIEKKKPASTARPRPPGDSIQAMRSAMDHHDLGAARARLRSMSALQPGPLERARSSRTNSRSAKSERDAALQLARRAGGRRRGPACSRTLARRSRSTAVTQNRRPCWNA